MQAPIFGTTPRQGIGLYTCQGYTPMRAEGHHHHDHFSPRDPAAAGAVVDPVCGMTVNPETAAHWLERGGQRFFFCSAGCKAKFEADPGKFLAPRSAAAAQPAPAGTIYTCPMHPEIRQEGPGFCPIC